MTDRLKALWRPCAVMDSVLTSLQSSQFVMKPLNQQYFAELLCFVVWHMDFGPPDYH